MELAFARRKDGIKPTGLLNYGAGKSFTSEPAEGGVNAEAAWAVYGNNAKGLNVNVVDIDLAWRSSHVDFPTSLLGFDAIADLDLKSDLINQHAFYSDYILDQAFVSHGNAMVGILAAPDNEFGATGIAPLATVGLQTTDRLVGGGGDVCEALPYAVTRAGYGGIVVVPHGETAFGYEVPIEWDAACYSAIEIATANRTTVVLAAGNSSSTNLDNAVFGGAFNRNVRDSGSIIVAMSFIDRREPFPGTTYGSRIDAHAPGADDLYTLYQLNTYQDFDGTSAASAVVAGALTSIQGIAKATRGITLSPNNFRSLINVEGVAQTHQLSTDIGRMPDILKAAQTGIARIYPVYVPNPNPQAASLVPAVMLLLDD